MPHARPDAFISGLHQLDVVERRTVLKREAEERPHPQGYLKALDMIDEFIALIRSSRTWTPPVKASKTDVDDVQADAILAMQLRHLAALGQKILDEHEVQRKIAITTTFSRSRSASVRWATSLTKSSKYGDERRTASCRSGEMNVEDLIAEENVV